MATICCQLLFYRVEDLENDVVLESQRGSSSNFYADQNAPFMVLNVSCVLVRLWPTSDQFCGFGWCLFLLAE